jgi:indole-3-glycerol phosphate synthase
MMFLSEVLVVAPEDWNPVKGINERNLHRLKVELSSLQSPLKYLNIYEL